MQTCSFDNIVRISHLIGWPAVYRLHQRLLQLAGGEYEGKFIHGALSRISPKKDVQAALLRLLGMQPTPLGTIGVSTEMVSSLGDLIWSVKEHSQAPVSSRLSAVYTAYRFPSARKWDAISFMCSHISPCHTNILDVLNDWRDGTMAVNAVLQLQGLSSKEDLLLLPSEKQIAGIIDKVLSPYLEDLTVALKLNSKKTQIYFPRATVTVIDKPGAAAALLDKWYPKISHQITTALLNEMQEDYLSRIREAPGASPISLYGGVLFKYLIQRILDENTEVLLTPPTKHDNMLAPVLSKWGTENRRIIVKAAPPCAMYYRDPTLKTHQYRRLDNFKEWYQANATHGLADVVLKTPEVREGVNDEKGIAGSVSFSKLENLCTECFSLKCENVDDYLPVFSNDSEAACMCHFPTQAYLLRDTHDSEPEGDAVLLSDDYRAWGEGPLKRMGKNQRCFMAWVWKLFAADDNSRQALFVSGTGMDGKSVIASVLKTVLGEQVSAVWDTDTTSDFVKQSLVGKRLLCAPDLKGVKKFLSSTLFHQVTGQDVVSFNVKNKNFSTGTFKGSKVLLLSNEKLETNGQKSIETRILWIPIEPREQLVEDSTFESRLLQQFPAFLRACEGASKDPDIVDIETGMIKQEPLGDRCQTAEDSIAKLLFDHYSDVICDGPIPLTVIDSEVRKASNKIYGSVIADRYKRSLGGRLKDTVTGNKGPEGFNVYSVRAKLDNMISNVRWVYNKGEVSLPDGLRAGYLAQREARDTVEIVEIVKKPATPQEPVDFDAMVAGAMHEDFLALD